VNPGKAVLFILPYLSHPFDHNLPEEYIVEGIDVDRKRIRFALYK
jgi:hypothetical protein